MEWNTCYIECSHMTNLANGIGLAYVRPRVDLLKIYPLAYQGVCISSLLAVFF